MIMYFKTTFCYICKQEHTCPSCAIEMKPKSTNLICKQSDKIQSLVTIVPRQWYNILLEKALEAHQAHQSTCTPTLGEVQ